MLPRFIPDQPAGAVAFTPDGKTCLCISPDGTVRRWPVAQPIGEPDHERLAKRVALMTGQYMDGSQGIDVVPAVKWKELRRELVGDGSTSLVPPRPDADWHDDRAADAEQDVDAFGASWHLDRLAALRPIDWTIPARRGRVLAAAGRRDEAERAYAAAQRIAVSPQPLADWFRVAAGVDDSAGRIEAALWNLDHAIAMVPDDWTLYAARASLAYKAGQVQRGSADVDEVLHRGGNDASTMEQLAGHAGEAGDWKRATALFNSVANQPELTHEQLSRGAIACLKSGDTAAYQAACAAIAKQTAPIGPMLSRQHARKSASVFALHGSATEDWSKPLNWIEHAQAALDVETWKSWASLLCLCDQ